MKKLLAIAVVSLFLLVLVGCEGEVTLTAPANFTISAANDEVSVVLDWDPNPSDEEVDGYIIYFNSASAGTTTNETYTHTDPQVSGTYYITAYKGDTESDPSATQSTEPEPTATTDLYEVSASGESGFGWNITSGAGSKYSMADDTHAGDIDLYFTDWATGYAGSYDLRSPDLAPSDPGATWLVGTTGWKVTGFISLTDNFDDVTVLPTTGYLDRVLDVAQDAAYGVYTEDGHYAVIEVQSISQATGLVQIRAAFQTVPGLAILEH
jgi:hypothetical protein